MSPLWPHCWAAGRGFPVDLDVQRDKPQALPRRVERICRRRALLEVDVHASVERIGELSREVGPQPCQSPSTSDITAVTRSLPRARR